MNRPMVSDAMRWLLWKDYRANRLLLWVTLFLLLAPYVVVIAVNTFCLWILGHDIAWTHDFVGAAFWSLILAQVMLAVLGGNAIAGERTDRSAEFLGSLPIARGRKLASKLWVGIGHWGLAWAPNLAILATIWMTRFERLPYGWQSGEIWARPVLIAVTGLTFFCVAWLFSAILESATVAAAAGLVTPWLVGMCVGLCHELVYWRTGVYPRDNAYFFFGYIGVCALLSIVGFIVGTRYYLRRIEP